MKPKALVTCHWPDEIEAEIAERFDAVFTPDDRPLDGAALVQALQDQDVIFATVTNRFTRDVFEAAQIRTRLIANYGVGYSHIDAKAARAVGVMVTNTPDVLTDCTADTALLLMLMAARRASEGEHMLRARQWQGFGVTHFLGTRLTGKTLGIIGMGRIGQATAARAHFGFGMKVVFHNRSKVDNQLVKSLGARQLVSIDEVLETSDFVSLHCPGGAENRHLINRDRLARMKPSAFLINTARGEVVDEEALADALETGMIAGAGLDVFDGEPNVNPRLISAPNASLLPHIGSATHETRLAMGRRALDNAIAFFDGRTPPDCVN